MFVALPRLGNDVNRNILANWGPRVAWPYSLNVALYS